MGERVLAIDDEADFLAIIEKTARSVGLTVEVTTDPGAFKSAVQDEPPGLVLVDLQMPGCDGIELLRFLCEQQSRAKVVLMSGFDARVLNLARDMGERLRLDMADPLQKPVRVSDLRQILSRFGGRIFRADGASLRQAIEEERLELHYQPLVDLRSGGTIGFEALVRWDHPAYGKIMPDRFIGLAEREQLINPLTQRVVELAVGQLATWRREGFAAFVSINVSAANIVDARLPDRLAELCAGHAVPPDRICLELTETAAMGNPTLMLEVLTRLRLKGFKLAIDDFGTGYSSLLQLHRLPFSKLKIDQSFVRDMTRSEEAALIVEAIAGLGKSLHLDLIAEGVETEDQLRRLVALGCETGQGYHFSRPMPADKIPDWMAAQPPGMWNE